MDLSQLRVRARQRTPWMAIDLGFVVARSWYAPLFKVWAIPSLAVFVVLMAVFWSRPWIAVLVWWWLKPLYDRLPLHIASRKLFGDDISVRDTLASIFRLIKGQWFTSLFWRRFSPSRSHDLPMICLEKLSGKRLQERISVTHIGSGTPALWLTVVSVHVEAILALSVFSAIWLFMPENMDIDVLPWFAQNHLIAQRVIYALSAVCACVVAPFYCASGFMLYISRRIDLEAWDIEIQFRNMLRKHEATTASSLGIMGLLLTAGLLTLSVFSPSTAIAQEEELAPRVEQITQELSRQKIEEIMAGEDFLNERTHRYVAFKEPGDDPNLFQRMLNWWRSLWNSDEDTDDTFDSDFLGFLGSLSFLVKWALILTGLFLVGYFVYWTIKYFQKNGYKSGPSSLSIEQPKVLFGLEVTEDSLPDDVTQSVVDLIDAGDLRAAMAMLFRSLLITLMHERGFHFSSGHTENECARIVAKTATPPLTSFTADVTKTWVSLAYAGNIPDSDSVRVLVRRWRGVFDAEG